MRTIRYAMLTVCLILACKGVAGCAGRDGIFVSTRPGSSATTAHGPTVDELQAAGAQAGGLFGGPMGQLAGNLIGLAIGSGIWWWERRSHGKTKEALANERAATRPMAAL